MTVGTFETRTRMGRGGGYHGWGWGGRGGGGTDTRHETIYRPGCSNAAVSPSTTDDDHDLGTAVTVMRFSYGSFQLVHHLLLLLLFLSCRAVGSGV